MTFQRIASQQFQQSRIFQVIPDRQNRIWISTLGKGIYIYDPHAGKLYNFNKAQTLPVDTVSALAADNSGRIWAATTIGLLSLDPAKNTLTRYTEQQGVSPATRTLTIFTAVPDQIWVGGVSGIDVLNLRQATYRHITPGDGLQGNVVTSFDRDLFGNVWYATTTGMGRINAEAATVHPLGPTQIVSQMEDAKKDLWVALQRGLYVVDSTRKTMRLLTKAEGLSDNFVQSFTRNGDSMLVTSDGGYNIYDPVKKELTLVGKDQGLTHDTVYVLFMDRSGNFWLTGPGAGISKIDPVTHRVSRLDITGGLNDNSIMDIKEDSRGLIWLATNHNGVDILDPVRGTIRYLTNQPGLSDICNRNLFADSKGNVWIGTDKGIYVANTRNKTLTILTTRQGLNNDLILSLLPYQHKVLASTGTGISIIEAPATDDAEHSWKISPLSNSEGLIKSTNSWATDAVTADGQYLWGDLGITMFSQIKPSEDSSFPAINGLTIMSQPMYFLNKPDALLRDDSLRTTAGTKFTSRELDSLGFASPEVFQWDSVAGPYNMPVHLVLPYNQNYLQFQFLEPGQSRLIKPEFTYILQGIDKKWSKPTTNNYSENYLNLPSGDYTFMVSSKGPDHKWSKPAEFHFRITPPWYQSWWVYTLLILLGIILLRVYIGYRSRMLQKENRVLEEKVQERTHQLQQSLEDLKATQSQLIQAEKMASLGELTAGIAHEIQNPLNFVNNFSEINMELIDELKETLDKTVIDPEEKTSISSLADDIRQNQEKINYHGKRADAIVKGMLQHSRNSSGQKELTDINALADEYLRLAFHGLRAKDKSFNAKMVTDFDQSLEKISIIPQDMGRVILNLITNAFYAVTDKKKHAAPENYEPTVTVTTKKLKGKVEIKVSDNGNGIPKRVLDKIFQPFFTTKPTGEGTGLGLSLSYDIVKTHGGEILVDTREGEGTTFIINLPV